MKTKIFIVSMIFLLVFESCSQQIKFTEPCTNENIINQCIVGFVPFDTNANVGSFSGILEISKRNCKVVNAKFHQ